MDPAKTRRGITAWVAGPPMVRRDSSLLISLVDDLLRLLKPYGIGSLLTSEPKIYHSTPNGLKLLAESLLQRRIDGISLGSEPYRVNDAGYACADLDFGQATYASDMALGIDVRIRPALTTDIDNTAASLNSFAKNWFSKLGAAAGFISAWQMGDEHTMGDFASRTSYEATNGLPGLMLWSDVCRFARGAFWATGLGPDLCAQLGGRERVLRDAPTVVAEPLGTGVWLQLSGVPPPDPVEVEHLQRFLAPVLNWRLSDTNYGQRPAPTPGELGARPTRKAGSPIVTRPADGACVVPIHFLRGVSGTDGVNIHLQSRPNRSQCAAIQALVSGWYRHGFHGGFGGTGLHSISGPIVDGNVLRWLVDFGDVDVRQAAGTLAQSLGQLKGVRVARLVFGTEQAA
jgi:hypothetical protein